MKIKAFNNLRADADAEENGKWAEIAPGVEWKLRRLRSNVVSKARAKIYGPFERSMNGKELPQATENSCTIRLISEAIVVDWRGSEMVDDETKKPIPFSAETCAALLADPETGKDLRALVIGFSNDADFYAPEDLAADMGNSGSITSGNSDLPHTK